MGQLFRLKHSPRTCDIVATLHNGPNDKTLFKKFFPLLSTLISLINVEVGINVEVIFFFKISDFREMRITSFKKCIDTKF